MREPSPHEIDQLLAFAPVFAASGFEAQAQPAHALMEANVITLRAPVYTEPVEQFYALAGEEPWCHQRYQDLQPMRLLHAPGSIEHASMEQVCAALTWCVRGERFAAGAWGQAIAQGHIGRILARLAQLRPR